MLKPETSVLLIRDTKCKATTASYPMIMHLYIANVIQYVTCMYSKKLHLSRAKSDAFTFCLKASFGGFKVGLPLPGHLIITFLAPTLTQTNKTDATMDLIHNDDL